MADEAINKLTLQLGFNDSFNSEKYQESTQNCMLIKISHLALCNKLTVNYLNQMWSISQGLLWDSISVQALKQ